VLYQLLLNTRKFKNSKLGSKELEVLKKVLEKLKPQDTSAWVVIGGYSNQTPSKYTG
jgi:ribosomal protein S7